MATPRDASDQGRTGVLQRSQFTTSRLAEFASEEELTRLIGHAREDWPIAALKELVDNALDDLRGAGVAPVIAIVVDESTSPSPTMDPDSARDDRADSRLRLQDLAERRLCEPYARPTGQCPSDVNRHEPRADGEPGVTVIELAASGTGSRSRSIRFRGSRASTISVPTSRRDGDRITLFWPVPWMTCASDL